MTPCYYCEEDADVACRACIHSSTGPEIEQVIAWRAAPPPAADAVSEAMTDAAMRQMRAVCGVERMSREQMWAVLDAALAARGGEVSEWKLMPVDPTPEMLSKIPDPGYPDDVQRKVYRSLLDAAPPPAEVTVDSLMQMAQEYASAWSLVGGPFDRGDMLDEAEDAKERLRRAIDAALDGAKG